MKKLIEVKVCELCGKEVNENKLVPVKIEVGGVGIVYNVCKECVEKNDYKEYDGADYASDWN